MRLSFLKRVGDWRAVADCARTTVGMESGKGEPSDIWKIKMLLAEHSPIRQLTYRAKWVNLPYWVSVHLSRHKYGIEHWVRSQRSDRTGEDRDTIPQGAFVEHEILVNAQAVINISRKRLCMMASEETREAWELFLKSLNSVEHTLASICVPDCVYRGKCFEYKSCGLFKNKYNDSYIRRS